MDGVAENRELSRWAEEKRASLSRAPPPDFGAVGPSRRSLDRVLAGVPGKLAVIAQPARRSAEEGHLRDDLDVVEFAHACVDAGVAALALGTDRRFGLRPNEWAPVLAPDFPLPVLHHDLVVSAAQLLDSRRLGADAVWLHLAVLDDPELAKCVELAKHLEMALVAEGRTPQELSRAVAAGARIVCASAFDEMGAQNADAALELLRGIRRNVLRVVRGPVSGEAGLAALRGEVDALWICGPASMPRDTYAYLRPLVEEAAGE